MENHCDDPAKCPTNIERRRDMKAMTEDYKRTTEALKETNDELAGIGTDLAVINNSVANLLDEIKQDREDVRQRDMRFQDELKTIHGRVTEGRVEAIKMIAKAQIAAAQESGDIKVNQASKLSTGDLFKLFAIFGTLLTIFGVISRYVN